MYDDSDRVTPQYMVILQMPSTPSPLTELQASDTQPPSLGRDGEATWACVGQGLEQVILTRKPLPIWDGVAQVTQHSQTYLVWELDPLKNCQIKYSSFQLKLPWGIPWWSSGSEPSANAGDKGSIPGLGRCHMPQSN